MSDDKELKPCPFCGGKRLFYRGHFAAGYCVTCKRCKTEGPLATGKDESKILWNERAK